MIMKFSCNFLYEFAKQVCSTPMYYFTSLLIIEIKLIYKIDNTINIPKARKQNFTINYLFNMMVKTKMSKMFRKYGE